MLLNAMVPVLLALAGVERCREMTKTEKREACAGVRAGWVLTALSAAYALVLLGTVAEYLLAGRTLDPVVSLAGVSLLGVRFVLKRWARASLGECWSPHVVIREGHRLVTTGAYRYLRHPAYLSAVLDLAGLPLLANAYCTLVTFSLLRLALLIVRIRIEERVLLERFGDEYRRYRRDTFAFVPLPKKLPAAFTRRMGGLP